MVIENEFARRSVEHVSAGRLAVLLLILGIFTSWPAISFAAQIEVGSEAPAFTAVDLEGSTRSLQEALDNGIVLLDFWSIYCVACMQEMPEIIELHNKYKDKGLTVVGINLDSFGVRRVKRFIKGLEYVIPFPVIIDLKRDIAGSYNISMLPTTILIGKDGKVFYHHIGYQPGDEDKFEELVKELLQ